MAKRATGRYRHTTTAAKARSGRRGSTGEDYTRPEGFPLRGRARSTREKALAGRESTFLAAGKTFYVR
jgi:hypothetical protein